MELQRLLSKFTSRSIHTIRKIIFQKKPKGLLPLAFFIFGIGSAAEVHAFSEMIRYGYVNCSSCHLSPNGGGILTDYGRELSREELAIWKSANEKSKENLAAYGLLADTKIQKHLKLGGDFRALYLYVNTPKLIKAQTYFMQGDLEAAYVGGPWTIDGTIGLEEPLPATNPQVQLLSRRHYVQFAIDNNWNLRAGRFVPSFGINSAAHILLTRSRLGLGYGLETYNFEVSRISEQWNIFATGTLGRKIDMENKSYHLDSALSGQVAFAPTEKMKIGVNAWHRVNDLNQERWLVGGFALLGLTQDLVFLTEFDFPMVRADQSVVWQNGMATTQKISWQAMDGFWPYLIQEYGKSDFTQEMSMSERYGIGAQIFPRLHFEFDLLYEKKRDGSGNTPYTDYAYLMSHFYL